jgi:indolepyruvate ferredoxin oxidoreductase beta subunit
MKAAINFLLAGVGGQGTILASDILVNAALAAGYSAKQAEVHGMSQRGGSVVSHVRWGEVVHSPITGAGEVDVLLAFEKLEALRNLQFLRPGAQVLINAQVIEPLTSISGDQAYPADEIIRTSFAALTPDVLFINGEEIATSLGNVRAANVVLLGALSVLLEHSGKAAPELTPELWLTVVSERVPPKHVELNRKAFLAGRQAAEKQN